MPCTVRSRSRVRLLGAHPSRQLLQFLTLRVRRQNGQVDETQVVCRLDTEEEREVFAAGGLLPRMRDEFLRAA